MYRNYPSGTSVMPAVNGNGFSIDLTNPSHETPSRIEKLLQTFGWKSVMVDPDTGEDLWQKGADNQMGNDIDPDLTGCYWRWYECIAYEFAKFVNIGLDG